MDQPASRPDLAAPDLPALRLEVALACRVLAHAGLAQDVLGHVSVRAGTDALLVRCRGPRESGLLFTTPDDIHLVGLDGPDGLDGPGAPDGPDGLDGPGAPDGPDGLDGPGAPDGPDRPDGSGDLPGGYAVPSELPIHVETLRARADVRAVVHAHPPAVVTADLAGLRLRPVVGAYNIPAMAMARDGIGVYQRGVLIRRADLAAEMLAAMGDAPACVLRGHGVTTTGSSVAQAVVRALNLESLARVMLGAAQAGRSPANLPEADLAELPDLGATLNTQSVWRYHLARLAQAGLGLPQEASRDA